MIVVQDIRIMNVFSLVRGFKGQEKLGADSLWSHGWQEYLGIVQSPEVVFLNK